MQKQADVAGQNLEKVKKKAPLIHAITNYVTMGWVADVLAAVGASPMMADGVDEVKQAAALADGMVLNLGTLNPGRLERIHTAGKRAMAKGIPIVLDPVGAGALSARSDAALGLLKDLKVSVIRANASEILAISGQAMQGKGMDTMHSVNTAQDGAIQVANRYGLTVVVTGEKDLITTGDRIFHVANGHSLMGRVPGTGCALGAIIASFLAVVPDTLVGALSAVVCFNCAGEMARNKAAAVGSFKVALIDSLDGLTPAIINQQANITDDTNP